MALWFEITATTPPDTVEQVADAMRAIAPGGVTIHEPVNILGPEQGYSVRAGEPVLVRAYLPSSELGAVLTEDLRRAMQAFPAVELTARPVFEEDWAVSWREFFGVVDTGGRVVIVPSWLEDESRPGQVAIRLDPGQAFGTGHHETTRLCLLALDAHVRGGEAVLDVGTGSGILAIAAILLGATRVHALDIDPIAVDVARANCHANGVARSVTFSVGPLDPGPVATHDLVIANISADANTALAPAFAKVVAPNGLLLLSGILATQLSRVVEAQVAEGFRLDAVRHERDWCLLEFRLES